MDVGTTNVSRYIGSRSLLYTSFLPLTGQIIRVISLRAACSREGEQENIYIYINIEERDGGIGRKENGASSSLIN